MSPISAFFLKKISMILVYRKENKDGKSRESHQNLNLPMDAPEVIRAFAIHKENFYGDGTLENPLVGGWLIRNRVVFRNKKALSWLQSSGFSRYGEYWGRPDIPGWQVSH